MVDTKLESCQNLQGTLTEGDGSVQVTSMCFYQRFLILQTLFTFCKPMWGRSTALILPL